MSKVNPGRMTHRHEGELIAFHIGMQITKPWRVDLWWPAFAAMPRMLRELSMDPDSGMLGYQMLLGRGGPYIVQYWDSIDKLYAYASDRSREHRPAWSEFNRRARRAPGAVGVWHETLAVSRAESMYVSTPTMGLAAATTLIPVERRHDRAAARYADGAATGIRATPAPAAGAEPATPFGHRTDGGLRRAAVD